MSPKKAGARQYHPVDNMPIQSVQEFDIAAQGLADKQADISLDQPETPLAMPPNQARIASFMTEKGIADVDDKPEDDQVPFPGEITESTGYSKGATNRQLETTLTHTGTNRFIKIQVNERGLNTGELERAKKELWNGGGELTEQPDDKNAKKKRTASKSGQLSLM